MVTTLQLAVPISELFEPRSDRVLAPSLSRLALAATFLPFDFATKSELIFLGLESRCYLDTSHLLESLRNAPFLEVEPLLLTQFFITSTSEAAQCTGAVQ